MSCDNVKGPINIEYVTDVSINPCVEKCNLQYNFKKLQFTVKIVDSTYICLEVMDDNIVATFASTSSSNDPRGGQSELTIKEIRIYQPSLHTYGTEKKQAEGEFIIRLNNNQADKSAIICIPISTQGTLSNATDQLNNILEYAFQAQDGLSPDTIKLNDFIPKKIGFYHYVAAPPWSSDEAGSNYQSNVVQSNIDYIVYPLKKVSIGISNQMLVSLKKFLKNPSGIAISSNPLNCYGYSYNELGAILGLGYTEQIYIDCQPTGSSTDKILENKTKNDILTGNASSVYSKLNQTNSEGIPQWVRICLIISVILLGCLVILPMIWKIVSTPAKRPNEGFKDDLATWHA
jgi:carbonic anhydrase